MEYFILGHEYGHLISGHLKEADGAEALPGVQADALVYSRKQELEADVFGVIVGTACMRHLRKVDIAMSFWGADLSVRRSQARSALAEILEDKTQLESITKFADIVSAVAQELWAHTRPFIEQLWKERISAWDRWQTSPRPAAGDILHESEAS
jgi:Zn-dependent protease with chaperone function